MGYTVAALVISNFEAIPTSIKDSKGAPKDVQAKEKLAQEKHRLVKENEQMVREKEFALPLSLCFWEGIALAMQYNDLTEDNGTEENGADTVKGRYPKNVLEQVQAQDATSRGERSPKRGHARSFHCRQRATGRQHSAGNPRSPRRTPGGQGRARRSIQDQR